MKVTYIGANTRKGVSDKTGNAYEISELSYAVHDESGQKKNPDGSTKWVYVAVGCTVRTLNIDPSAIPSFSDISPFTEVDLKLEPQLNNPARNWVTGIQ